MSSFLRWFVASFLTAYLLGSSTSTAQAAQGSLHGQITDSSGGVLPGVTVLASSADRRLFATTVTDAVGVYELKDLPATRVTLTFQLDGFQPGVVNVDVLPQVDSVVGIERLGLAPITESVTVRGKAPARRDPPPPPLVVVPVQAHDRESVCGPAKAEDSSESLGTIRSLKRQAGRALYSKRDELVIDRGSLDGLAAGQNLVVRRYYRVAGPGTMKGEHTAGLIQVARVDERSSIAVVLYACDELMQGDFLARFRPEPLRTPDRPGAPAYYDAAQILFADIGQMMGVPQRLLVIDRGMNYGMRAGQRLTLFRREGRHQPAILGDAVVVAVRSDSATIRVERATEAISFGDWAAAERQSPATF